jgi:hypothetical protein
LLANSGSEGSEQLTLNQGSRSSLAGQVKELGQRGYKKEYENLESTKNYSSSKFNSPEVGSPTALINCNTNASDRHFNQFQMH